MGLDDVLFLIAAFISIVLTLIWDFKRDNLN